MSHMPVSGQLTGPRPLDTLHKFADSASRGWIAPIIMTTNQGFQIAVCASPVEVFFMKWVDHFALQDQADARLLCPTTRVSP